MSQWFITTYIASGGAAPLTDYYSSNLDTNTAIRNYLNDYYSTTNLDLAPLLARYLQEGTDEDSSNVRKRLERRCRGDAS